MKVHSTVKSGSITLANARRAAREAKSARDGASLADVSPSVRESLVKRYLGHFGPTAKKTATGAGASKTARPAAKKARPAAKKAVARKVSRKAKRKAGNG